MAAGQQSGIELERRILRGRADQDDRAVFDHRQEAVLLGAIEAMHLVDEEDRALSQCAALARTVEGLAQIGNAREDRRELNELAVGRAREESGDGGLAGAGRSPQDQRLQSAGVDHAAEWPVGAKQMVLPQHLI